MKNDDSRPSSSDARTSACLRPLRLRANKNEKYSRGQPVNATALSRPQLTMERLLRLETLVLNQTFIIEQLTCALSAMMPQPVRAQVLDSSAEDILALVFTDGVPLAMLDLAVEWRRQIGRPSIMQISE